MTKTLKIQFFIQIVKNKFSFNQIIHLDKKLRSLDYWPIDLHLGGCPHRVPAPPLRTQRPGSGVSGVLSVASPPRCPDSHTACSPETRSSLGSVGSQSPDTYRPTHTQIIDNLYGIISTYMYLWTLHLSVWHSVCYIQESLSANAYKL